MEDYKIFIESTVLSSVHQFSKAEMTPTGGSADYSTYHVEIPANNITGNSGQEYWVIVERQGYDYTNTLGVTNLAGTDPLAAMFRYNLNVSATEVDKPICDIKIDPSTPMPQENLSPVAVKFDASG